MNENVDKQLENLVDKVMKKSTLESPSFDFTASIMSEVARSKQTLVTKYQPLISKRVWAMMIFGFGAFALYIVISAKPEASNWFTTIDLNSEKFYSVFKGIHLPRTAAYGIGLLAMMLLIQIPILKNYFDKRILS